MPPLLCLGTKAASSSTYVFIFFLHTPPPYRPPPRGLAPSRGCSLRAGLWQVEGYVPQTVPLLRHLLQVALEAWHLALLLAGGRAQPLNLGSQCRALHAAPEDPKPPRRFVEDPVKPLQRHAPVWRQRSRGVVKQGEVKRGTLEQMGQTHPEESRHYIRSGGHAAICFNQLDLLLKMKLGAKWTNKILYSLQVWTC